MPGDPEPGSANSAADSEVDSGFDSVPASVLNLHCLRQPSALPAEWSRQYLLQLYLHTAGSHSDPCNHGYHTAPEAELLHLAQLQFSFPEKYRHPERFLCQHLQNAQSRHLQSPDQSLLPDLQTEVQSLHPPTHVLQPPFLPIPHIYFQTGHPRSDTSGPVHWQ